MGGRAVGTAGWRASAVGGCGPSSPLPPPPNPNSIPQGYPEGHWINFATWNRGGSRLAFCTRSPGGPGDAPRGPLALWAADVETGRATLLIGTDPRSPSPDDGDYEGLNAVFEDYAWIDDDTIVAAVIPPARGQPPHRLTAPPGPRIQDNSGGATSQGRTYQDLLKAHGRRVGAGAGPRGGRAGDVACGRAAPRARHARPSLTCCPSPSPPPSFSGPH